MGPIHAGLCELFEELPELLVGLLVELGHLADVAWRVELRPTEALLPDRQRSFKEVRADLVLLLRPPLDESGVEPGEDACVAILLETQLVIDWSKLTRWRSFGLAYKPDLCEHIFLVALTLSAKTELWMRRDIQTWIDDVRMVVVSPRNLAWDAANSPGHALLAAVFEPDGEGAQDRLIAAIRGLSGFPAKRRMVYEEMLLSSHGEERVMTAVRKIDIMDTPEVQAVLDKWPGYEPNERELNSFLYVRGERRGLQRGLLRGRAEALLALLEHRGLPVDDATSERILDCHDLEQLDRWMGRALRVESAEQIFAD